MKESLVQQADVLFTPHNPFSLAHNMSHDLNKRRPSLGGNLTILHISHKPKQRKKSARLAGAFQAVYKCGGSTLLLKHCQGGVNQGGRGQRHVWTLPSRHLEMHQRPCASPFLVGHVHHSLHVSWVSFAGECADNELANLFLFFLLR